MKLVKNAIVKAFSASNRPGLVSVKRFSASKVRVRRFSQDGEVEFDETVEDEAIACSGTDELVEEVPAESVAVFSDEDKAVDEIIAEVDGGDATPIIEAKTEDGFVEDTEEVKDEDEESGEDDKPAVEEECGDDTASILKEASKKK